MFQEDFLMREIARIAQALQRLIGLRQTQRHEEALQTLDEALDDLLGLGLDAIDALSADDLARWIQMEADHDAAQIALALAALLRERALLLVDAGEAARAAHTSDKARRLLALLAPDTPQPLIDALNIHQ